MRGGRGPPLVVPRPAARCSGAPRAAGVRAAALLDAGCGTGGNLAAFGPGAGRRPRARGGRGLRARAASTVVQASLEALPFADGVVRPPARRRRPRARRRRRRARCASCGGSRRPARSCVVTVPAHPRLWSAHDEALHHRRRYRRAELLGARARRGVGARGRDVVELLPAAARRARAAAARGADGTDHDRTPGWADRVARPTARRWRRGSSPAARGCRGASRWRLVPGRGAGRSGVGRRRPSRPRCATGRTRESRSCSERDRDLDHRAPRPCARACSSSTSKAKPVAIWSLRPARWARPVRSSLSGHWVSREVEGGRGADERVERPAHELARQRRALDVGAVERRASRWRRRRRGSSDGGELARLGSAARRGRRRRAGRGRRARAGSRGRRRGPCRGGPAAR